MYKDDAPSPEREEFLELRTQAESSAVIDVSSDHRCANSRETLADRSLTIEQVFGLGEDSGCSEGGGSDGGKAKDEESEGTHDESRCRE